MQRNLLKHAKEAIKNDKTVLRDKKKIIFKENVSFTDKVKAKKNMWQEYYYTTIEHREKNKKTNKSTKLVKFC